MSIWTHVNASIRYDGMPGLMGEPITKEELGPICRFNSWKDTFVPCGSEGSLEYKIIKTGSENSLACRAVLFTGDLRDYDDEGEILRYFSRIVKDKMVRSGFLLIDIEGKGLAVYILDCGSNEWKKNG